MNMKTKPLLIAIAISVALSNQAIAAYTPNVAAGTTVNGETIQLNSDVQYVYGTANSTSLAMGKQYIDGVANDTNISNSGDQFVEYGGVVNRENISTKGYAEVNGEANDSVITTGGKLVVNQGALGNTILANAGHANRSVINAGGILQNRLGNDTDTIVNSGGLLESGLEHDTGWKNTGLTKNATINAGGLQTVNNGGSSDGSTVNINGVLKVQYVLHDWFPNDPIGLQYGTADNTVVHGTMENNGGIDNNTLIKSDGSFSVTGNTVDNQKAVSNNATIEGNAKIKEIAQANHWTIAGSIADYVSLETDSSEINDSTVNSGNLSINKGTATNTILNNGVMVNVAGADINTVVNGGTYSLGGADAATSSNLTVNSGASANINSGTVTDATISGNMCVLPKTSTPGTISTLQGNIKIDNGGQLTLINGVNTKSADVALSGSGGLYLVSNASGSGPNDFTLGSMAMNGGNVYFDQASGGAPQVGYSTLTLASLDGNGSFYMNSELASKLGDFLTVKGQANGSFDIHIADTGVSPTSNSSLKIIQTGGGNAGFTLANKGHVVDVGTYQYQLVADGKGGWALTPQAAPTVQVIPASVLTPSTPAKQVIPASVLTPSTPAKQSVPVTVLTPATQTVPLELPPEQKPGALMITPSTAAVLSMATVDPLIFHTELGSVRSRLDQVRSFSHETNVWGHYTTSHSNVEDTAGAGYGMNVNGVTIGADKSNEATNSVTTLGAFFSYSHSDVDFDRGGDGNVDSYSAGVYTSYLHNSGFYFDGVLKANHFGNEINGRMTSGAAAHGDYNTTGIGAHLQGGKYFYFGQTFIAPYASVTGFTSNSSDFSLSNGMKGHTDPQRSVTGETGISLGHKFVVHGAQVQPYLKVAVMQEFIDDNTVKVNEDHFTNDVSGTRGAYQLGVDTKVTDMLTVHADAGYTQGRHIEAPWTANLGASWSF